MKRLIPRDFYMGWLDALRDRDVIKVLTGVRRCGKSTVMQMFCERLRAGGVGDSQIASVNFEEIENTKWLADYEGAYYDILGRLDLSKPCYVFLDEVQNVREFERLVGGLRMKPNVDVYVTGSNAWLLSGELATLLTGRYMQIHVLPLSFAEFASAFPATGMDALFADYLEFGGMPGRVGLPAETVPAYLRDIHHGVVEKDILPRHRWHSGNQFDRVTQFVFDSVGLPLSAGKIAATLKADGAEISHNTVSNYLNALADAFLFYRARRYDVRGRRILVTQEKHYTSDLGFKRAIVGKGMVADMGRNFENVIYLELLRRGNRVFTGKSGDREIDFVAQTPDGRVEYYQAAVTVRDERTLARELSAFPASDHHPKTLLTLDPEEGSHNGILQRNALKWLLEANPLNHTHLGKQFSKRMAYPAKGGARL